MTPEDFVIARIEDINTSAGARVWAMKLPQKPTLPAVRVQRISGVLGQHLRGPNGIYVTRVQVDSYCAETSGGDPMATVTALANEIAGDGLGSNASGLWGFVGEFGSPASIKICNVELDQDGTPLYEGEELRLIRIRQDYLVHWKAA